MEPFKNGLAMAVHQSHIEAHQRVITAGLTLDRFHPEFAPYGIADENRLEKPRALLDKGYHRVLDPARHRGRAERCHGRDKQAVCEPLAVARLLRVSVIVMDRV